MTDNKEEWTQQKHDCSIHHPANLNSIIKNDVQGDIFGCFPSFQLFHSDRTNKHYQAFQVQINFFRYDGAIMELNKESLSQ